MSPLSLDTVLSPWAVVSVLGLVVALGAFFGWQSWTDTQNFRPTEWRQVRTLSQPFAGTRLSLNAEALFSLSTARPTPAPALNAGWLRWERDTDSFTVQRLNGPQSIPKGDFISQGQLHFESVSALFPAQSGENLRWYAANPYGIWQYTNANLPLNSDGIRHQPFDLSDPANAADDPADETDNIVAAHGRITSPAGQWRLNRTSLSLDSIRLEEDYLTGRITVTNQSG